MTAVFETAAPLRFAECDPAGIAFYPRLVERVNNIVEDWMAGPIGHSFAAMHGAGEGRVAAPCRSLALEFLAPGRLGEVVSMALRVAALGRASVTLDIVARLPDGRVMFTARPVIVWCAYEGDAMRAAAIPPAVRARMAGFLAGDAAGA